MISRKQKYAGLFAALPLALAGCSSSSSGSPSGSTTPSSPASATAPAAQLTGTQLTGALLTAADLPTGFSVSSGSAVDSGAALTTAAAKYNPATLSCADLLNDLGKTGFGESAMSDNTLANQTSSEIFNQAVYQFATATAANVYFTSLEAKWNSCGSFSESASGASGTVKITAGAAPSGLGDMAFVNTMSATEDGSTLSGSNLVVLKGDDVFLVGPGSISASQPADLVGQTLIQKLMANVAAAG
jgi:hypothetical protein